MPFQNSGAGTALANLTPRPTQITAWDNYMSFDSASGGGTFLQQFLPEIYEKEVERYGKRTVSGFLKMVGAEMPLASDQVIWSEQGRLHIAYDDGVAGEVCNIVSAAGNTIALPSGHQVQVNDTIIVRNLSRTAPVMKARVSAVNGSGGAPASGVVALPYATNDFADTGFGYQDADNLALFVYGNEFAKGSANLTRSMDASFTQFSNRPMIIRDRYSVSGSNTAQIGWVEVTTENGASGYLWYLKSEAETRLRFEDYLEMAMIEAEEVESGSAITGVAGSQGLFDALESRGLVFTGTDFDIQNASISGANSGATAQNYVHQNGLAEFDAILQELDSQGAIEENMMFLDRGTSLEIDNMLASQNSAVVGGSSYGVFNNEEDMALNLGFSGFRRGSYDFYKTDWKYLNDSVTRGNFSDVEGLIVPAGTSTVYDESLGKNIARPFLHVRYRASEADDRKMKSWITGSVGGNYTSDEDAMNVNFLSERCLCVQAANNFVLLKS
tara:strand:- start:2004 stop:3500 length:1497 start_codon:yes stop_codon:yes gene_type:complete